MGRNGENIFERGKNIEKSQSPQCKELQKCILPATCHYVSRFEQFVKLVDWIDY